ncbi:MAG: methyltransferase [Planctomycetota bacterium]|jgi:precorrin-6B methylase 2
MATKWTRDKVMEISGAFQPACVLMAAADLNLFEILNAESMTAEKVADQLQADPRAMTMLLDALAAMELLDKGGTTYSVPPEVVDVLTQRGANSVLQMVRHRANCMRRWVQLARVIQTGKPAEREPSVRGEAGDQESFIGAMHNVANPIAQQMVEELGPLEFQHLLDVGGGSGSWTVEFLRAVPGAKATIFDLPDVILMARARMADAGMSDRVTMAGGDFYEDDLPAGADFVWLSAIAHQNSRRQNRELFAKIHKAMDDGGMLIVRDVVMDESRTKPLPGAMFAINMLVATEGGGTYTLDEYREDLEAAGFSEVSLVRLDQFMESYIRARKK